MKEKGIIFSGPMVLAILEGRKSMTRRIVSKNNSTCSSAYLRDLLFNSWKTYPDHGYLHVSHSDGETVHRVWPKWEIGDRLWVRETWQICSPKHMLPGEVGYPWYGNSALRVVFKADCQIEYHPEHPEWGKQTWRPSIHLPRRASRITLEIVSVRVERLQEISEDDAKAEGIDPYKPEYPGDRNFSEGTTWFREGFDHLWTSIHGPGSWTQNPWVWVIEFKRAA